MSKKKKPVPLVEPDDVLVQDPAPAVVEEERRAPDQDGAIEVAFVDDVLPEEDRRAASELAPTEGLHVTHPDQFAALSGVPNAPAEPALPETNDLHGFSNPDIGRKPIVTD